MTVVKRRTAEKPAAAAVVSSAPIVQHPFPKALISPSVTDAGMVPSSGDPSTMMWNEAIGRRLAGRDDQAEGVLAGLSCVVRCTMEELRAELDAACTRWQDREQPAAPVAKARPVRRARS